MKIKWSHFIYTTVSKGSNDDKSALFQAMDQYQTSSKPESAVDVHFYIYLKIICLKWKSSSQGSWPCCMGLVYNISDELGVTEGLIDVWHLHAIVLLYLT